VAVATRIAAAFRSVEDRLGLTAKLLVQILVILLAIGALLTWYSLSKAKALLVDELKLRHTAQTHYWINNNLINLISPDPEQLERLARGLRASAEVAYVLFYTPQSKLIVASGVRHEDVAPLKLSVSNPADLQPLFERVANGSLYELSVPILLPRGSDPQAPISDVTAILPAASNAESPPEVLGVIRLGIAADSVNAKMAAIQGDSIKLASAVVLLGLALSYVLTRRSTRPIQQIAQQATAIANGDFSRVVELRAITSADEVGDLAHDFYDMSVKLKQSREKLEEFNRELEQKVQERTGELQEANRKLTELDELKSNFLSTVSHELRTPLTSIKAFAEILLDNQGEDRDTQLRFLQIINTESERLSRLISDLLDLSKIESGAVRWKMEPLDPRDIVEKSLESLSLLAAQKVIQIRHDVPPEVPRIHGDHDRLVQVVTNLVSNALKFTNEGGSIDISIKTVARDDGQYREIPLGEAGLADFVQVAVRDTGIGVPREHLTAVFDKFHQVDSAVTRRRGGGTGLGLAICKEIVEHHQGSIWAKSEVGQGSTFYFALPCARAFRALRAEAASQRAPAAALSGERPPARKVLVVDDEPHIREFLRYELINEGYEVIEAADGEQALELARRERPDIITLDIMMPGIDGFDTLSILNHDEQTASIPVIVITVVDDPDKGFTLGAVDYLVKPIDCRLFVESIRRIANTIGGTRQQKVLVIEDDQAVADALASMLATEGFKPFVACNGESGVEEALAVKPDLVVLDLKLPGISGYEVLRRLKVIDATKSTPIVVITASDLGRGKSKSLALGASEYLTKPLSKRQFLDIIKRLLAEAKVDV
jgi:signal transduction histidine kinase/DNA-binding response OmpR family regulator